MEKIAKKIRELLKNRQMSQKELADALGYSTVYISDLLRGKKGQGLKVETLEQIAKVLDAPKFKPRLANINRMDIAIIIGKVVWVYREYF